MLSQIYLQKAVGKGIKYKNICYEFIWFTLQMYSTYKAYSRYFNKIWTTETDQILFISVDIWNTVVTACYFAHTLFKSFNDSENVHNCFS